MGTTEKPTLLKWGTGKNFLTSTSDSSSSMFGSISNPEPKVDENVKEEKPKDDAEKKEENEKGGSRIAEGVEKDVRLEQKEHGAQRRKEDGHAGARRRHDGPARIERRGKVGIHIVFRLVLKHTFLRMCFLNYTKCGGRCQTFPQHRGKFPRFSPKK